MVKHTGSEARCIMEVPRKYNDCYFYYYSTCTKGDNCIFRHEPMALGCETMCPNWQQGKCVAKRCKLRHMELRKNRKQIPCYWENQPGGCRKKHCPFMHKNPDARTDGIAPTQPGPPIPVPMGQVATMSEPIPVQMPPEAQMAAPAATPLIWPQQRQVVLDSSLLGVIPPGELLSGRPAPSPYTTMPVDSLVVNFEEETKIENKTTATNKHGAETQELELLQKIQDECAAYYSFDEPNKTNPITDKPEDSVTMNMEGRRASILSNDFRTRSKSESLCNKRKLATYDSITSTAKVLKVVRSNSIVYKKLDENSHKYFADLGLSRRRTCSEQSEVIEIHENNYQDCYKFRRPSIDKVRKVSISDTSDVDYKDISDASKIDTSDSDVQIINISDDEDENVNNEFSEVKSSQVVTVGGVTAVNDSL